MPRLMYYIPSSGLTYDDAEADNDVHAIEVIKDREDVKRVPPSWKIWLENEKGQWVEVNRRAIARHRQEAKKNR